MTALPVCKGKQVLCCSAEAFPAYLVLVGRTCLKADFLTFSVRIIQQMHKVPAASPSLDLVMYSAKPEYVGGRGNYTEVRK